MIVFECPTCKHAIQVSLVSAGKTGKCGRCKELVRVPDHQGDFIPSPSFATKVVEPVPFTMPEAPALPKDSWLYVLLFVLLGYPFALALIKAAGMIQYVLYPAILVGVGYLFYDSKIRNQVFNSVSVFDPVKRYTILVICCLLTFNFLFAGELGQPAKEPSVTAVSEKKQNKPQQKTVEETPGIMSVPVEQKKWYQGGTLHRATGREWRLATFENKLATCGDFVAGMWNDGALRPEIARKITTTDDFKPYAYMFVTYLDRVFRDDDSPSLDKDVSEAVAIGFILMELTK